jgi:hypothetical protein
MELRGCWGGWEWLTKNELHMYQSKRHYFLSGKPVCGVRVPPKGASFREGDMPCAKCLDWCEKHGIPTN